MNLPSDHTFGVLFKPDNYGAGDLMHGRTPDRYLKGREHQLATLAAVRQHLKKSNYHHFNDLKSAFQFYDKVCCKDGRDFDYSTRNEEMKCFFLI